MFSRSAQRLEGFSRLGDNCNGEHAIAPTREPLDHAHEILEILYNEAVRRKIKAPEPRITCGARGDITFAWKIDEREIELGFNGHSRKTVYEYLICEISGRRDCIEGSFKGEVLERPAIKTLPYIFLASDPGEEEDWEDPEDEQWDYLDEDEDDDEDEADYYDDGEDEEDDLIEEDDDDDDEEDEAQDWDDEDDDEMDYEDYEDDEDE
jgi:hypothetical protein